MRQYLLGTLLLLTLLASGCAAKPAVTQVNTIDSLLAGVYDGSMTLAELKNYGDFGIGTFTRLDGEMVLLNGVVYQVRADGKVYRPDDGVTTPFAAVAFWSPQTCEPLSKLDFRQFCERFDVLDSNRNGVVALKITGRFASVKVRSVPAQDKPYRPLAEVTKSQPEFTLEHVTGTVVGYRLPPFVKGINVPGYHLHFIDDSRMAGGHILDFELDRGTVEWRECNVFTILLPSGDSAFAAADLTLDRSRELHQAESAKTQK